MNWLSFLRPIKSKCKPGDSFFTAQWHKRFVRGSNKRFTRESDGALRFGKNTSTKENQDDKT